MQGMTEFVHTLTKINYLKSLLKVGFGTLDCGSFVNPTAVPQMADTEEIIDEIGSEKGNTRLLVIVANERGAREASAFDAIDDLGFPFSINETFQKRNANSGVEESFTRLQHIKDIADAENKRLVVYLSMAFGNPYGEDYDRDQVLEWAHRVASIGVSVISLADTVGQANTEDISYLFQQMQQQFPHIETGAHFHARPGMWIEKAEQAQIDLAKQLREQGVQETQRLMNTFGGRPAIAGTPDVPTETYETVRGTPAQAAIAANPKLAYAEALNMQSPQSRALLPFLAAEVSWTH
jgi:hydroxymethylglutaryl-CoA lyase